MHHKEKTTRLLKKRVVIKINAYIIFVCWFDNAKIGISVLTCIAFPQKNYRKALRYLLTPWSELPLVAPADNGLAVVGPEFAASDSLRLVSHRQHRQRGQCGQ